MVTCLGRQCSFVPFYALCFIAIKTFKRRIFLKLDKEFHTTWHDLWDCFINFRKGTLLSYLLGNFRWKWKKRLLSEFRILGIVCQRLIQDLYLGGVCWPLIEMPYLLKTSMSIVFKNVFLLFRELLLQSYLVYSSLIKMCV